MVHKSGHHFDLVNWWLNAQPETVAAMGKLAFYGDENGKRHGWARNYERARGSAEAKGDPFAIDLEGDETLKSIYADAEKEDGYHRDQNVSACKVGAIVSCSHVYKVFAPGIGIEDDMSLLVRYNTGATMTYHLVSIYCSLPGLLVLIYAQPDCLLSMGGKYSIASFKMATHSGNYRATM